eukprot:3679589-Amphidinium_carterae.1
MHSAGIGRCWLRNTHECTGFGNIHASAVSSAQLHDLCGECMAVQNDVGRVGDGLGPQHPLLLVPQQVRTVELGHGFQGSAARRRR